MTVIGFPTADILQLKRLDEIDWDPNLGKPHGTTENNGVREPEVTGEKFWLRPGDRPTSFGMETNDLARYKDMVNHPPHYTTHPSGVECIDVVRHMPYNIGVAMAYLWRHEQKGGTEDLRKAIWHIEDQIKWREKKASRGNPSDADGYHGC